MHLGLALVAVSALLSKQAPRLSVKQIGGLVLAALALLIWQALERRRPRVGEGPRLLTALAAALLWSLAHAPRLSGWAPEGTGAHDLLGYLQVSLGTIGVLLAFLSWLLYRAAGGEKTVGPVPARWAAVGAGVLIIVQALYSYFMLSGMYGSGGDLSAGMVSFQALQFMALMTVVLGTLGGPLVRRAPGWYLGAALLAVAALNLVAGKGGGM
jgi:hypothetical protein